MNLFDVLVFLFKTLVFPGLLFIILLALFLEWFKRKLVARMQSRLGPTYTGWHGILQPLADFLKLLFKEDIEVKTGDQPAVTAALIIAPVLLLFNIVFLIPWTGTSILGFEGDALVALLLSTLASTLLYIIGWGFESPFTRVGAMRIILQIVGFDVAALALVAVPVYEAKSLQLEVIASKVPQVLLSKPYYLLAHIPALILFLLSQQADLEEDPFDIPHAETEIVAGYMTEVSGRKLAFLDLFRDLQVAFVAVFTATLYFGVPRVFPGVLGDIVTALLLVVEALVVLFILFAVEAACARIRIFDLLRAFWKYLIPASFAIIALLFTVEALFAV